MKLDERKRSLYIGASGCIQTTCYKDFFKELFQRPRKEREKSKGGLQAKHPLLDSQFG